MLTEVMARCQLTFMQMSINVVRTVLAVDALMQRKGLPFNALGLLYVYSVACLRSNPETHMYSGNLYL